ncbi:MAG: glycosyltransferase [Syntrophobacteraceae bacterium]
MLEGMGVEIAMPVELKRLLLLRRYSIAYLSFYDTACQYLTSIRSFSPQTRIVIDTVDIHFLRELRGAQLSRNPVDMRRAESTRKTELAVYTRADALITVTEKDWQSIETYMPAKSHFVIPNIHSAPDRLQQPSTRSGLLFIGSFDHLPNVDALLYFVKEILPLIRAVIPNITLEAVGVNPPESIQDLRNQGVTVTGYVASTEPYLLKARVSIAPLRYGAGMKGKIGEAMAYGLPVVTTSVGAEGMGLEHGKTAFIADTPAEFAQEVVKLCSDDDLWRIISENAQRCARLNYSPRVVATAIHTMMTRPADLQPCNPDASNTTAFCSRVKGSLERILGGFKDACGVWKKHKDKNSEGRRYVLRTIDDQCDVRLFLLLYPFYVAANAFRVLVRKAGS